MAVTVSSGRLEHPTDPPIPYFAERVARRHRATPSVRPWASNRTRRRSLRITITKMQVGVRQFPQGHGCRASSECKPLVTHQVIIQLIANTTTTLASQSTTRTTRRGSGLHFRDCNPQHPTRQLHGEWNLYLRPKTARRMRQFVRAQILTALPSQGNSHHGTGEFVCLERAMSLQ